MSRLVKAFCLVLELAGCNDEDTFNVNELISEPAQETTDVGERWLREILSSMQGDTGQYLIERAQHYDITVSYADDLQHRIGEFSPSGNAITLELPLGIETATGEQFQEMVLTGRRVMYEELDHGVRHHERNMISGLSAQEHTDGLHTSNEAIARITAYVGMSEDAQIGSAPAFETQLGMPENGYAIYYSTTDAEMADRIIAGLAEGQQFHETPELMAEAFAAFYGTSTSEFYTLYYASAILPDSFEYTRNVSLAQVLDDYREGNDLQFEDFVRFANQINSPNTNLLESLHSQFDNGDFTNEAEQLTLNDLLRARQRWSQPDGGRANHLTKTRSGGNFFRDASPERISEAFGILTNDAEIIQSFMGSCIGKSYLSEDARSVAQNNYDVMTGYLPLLRETVGQVQGSLSEPPRWRRCYRVK